MTKSLLLIFSALAVCNSARKEIASLTAHCNMDVCETCIYEKCAVYPAGNFTVSINCRGQQCVTCLNDRPCETSGLTSRGGSVVDIDTYPSHIRRRPVSDSFNEQNRYDSESFAETSPFAGQLRTSFSESSSEIRCQRGVCQTCVDGFCRTNEISVAEPAIECYNGVCASLQGEGAPNEQLDTFQPPMILPRRSEPIRKAIISSSAVFSQNRGTVRTPQAPVPVVRRISQPPTSVSQSSATTRCVGGVCKTCVNGECSTIPNLTGANSVTSFSRSIVGANSKSTSAGFGLRSNPASSANLAQQALNQQVKSILENPYCVSSSFCRFTHICVNNRCVQNPNGRRHIEWKTCVVGLAATSCPDGFECHDRACFEPLRPQTIVRRSQLQRNIPQPRPVPAVLARGSALTKSLPFIRCKYPFECGVEGMCELGRCVPGPSHGARACNANDNYECPNQQICVLHTCFEKEVVEQLYG